MTDRPNGLAALTDARQRARRTMPAPRHPAARTAPDASQSVDGQGGPPEPRTVPSLSSVKSGQFGRPPVEDSVPTPVTAMAPVGDRGRPTPSVAAVEPPIKLTFYVDPDIDRYLEDVRIQGLMSQPRVDVSRSAVVRLALRRLREEMTPDQVKTLLVSQPTDPTRAGRKRR